MQIVSDIANTLGVLFLICLWGGAAVFCGRGDFSSSNFKNSCVFLIFLGFAALIAKVTVICFGL